MRSRLRGGSHVEEEAVHGADYDRSSGIDGLRGAGIPDFAVQPDLSRRAGRVRVVSAMSIAAAATTITTFHGHERNRSAMTSAMSVSMPQE